MIEFSVPPERKTEDRLLIKTAAGDCVLVYRNATIDELEEDQWRVAFAAKSIDPGAARAALMKARRAAILIGWDGIVDAKQQPIPFSQDKLVALTLRVPEVELAVGQLLDRVYSLDAVLGEPVPPRVDGIAADPSTLPGPWRSKDSNDEQAEPDSRSSSE